MLFCSAALKLQSHRSYIKAEEIRAQLKHKWAEFFVDFDILLSPVTLSAAYPVDEKTVREERKITVSGQMVDYNDQLFWSGYLHNALSSRHYDPYRASFKPTTSWYQRRRTISGRPHHAGFCKGGKQASEIRTAARLCLTNATTGLVTMLPLILSLEVRDLFGHNRRERVETRDNELFAHSLWDWNPNRRKRLIL